MPYEITGSVEQLEEAMKDCPLNAHLTPREVEGIVRRIKSNTKRMAFSLKEEAISKLYPDYNYVEWLDNVSYPGFWMRNDLIIPYVITKRDGTTIWPDKV